MLHSAWHPGAASNPAGTTHRLDRVVGAVDGVAQEELKVGCCDAYLCCLGRTAQLDGGQGCPRKVAHALRPCLTARQ